MAGGGILAASCRIPCFGNSYEYKAAGSTFSLPMLIDFASWSAGGWSPIEVGKPAKGFESDFFGAPLAGVFLAGVFAASFLFTASADRTDAFTATSATPRTNSAATLGRQRTLNRIALAIGPARVG